MPPREPGSGHGYAGPSSTSGQLAVTDADQASGHVWTLDGSASGTYGTFAINATTGKWTYVLDDTKSATQALAEGHDGTETFTVRVTDAYGASATVNVIVTVHGSNDAPVITGSTYEAHAASGLTGFTGADIALDHKFEPVQDIDATIAPLMVSGMNMAQVLSQVQASLGGATLAQAIAQVWDYIDDHGGYYNNLLNEASARLAVEYAKYLLAGGTPLRMWLRSTNLIITAIAFHNASRACMTTCSATFSKPASSTRCWARGRDRNPK